MRVLRATSDSPTSHETPPPIADRHVKIDRYVSKSAAENGGLSDDPKQLDRYLDAVLARDSAIPLSRYGAAYRDYSRGDTSWQDFHAELGACVPTPRIVVDASGREHLAPEWRSFDPGLAREIRYQIRAIETAGRFQRASTLDRSEFDKSPGVVVPTPQYRGVKMGRKIIGKNRPVEGSNPTFYLPRNTDVQDTLSATSVAAAHGKAISPDDSSQWEAIALCVELAQAVAERLLSVAALAAVLLRLRAPESVVGACFYTLGHRDRKRLGKALRAA